MPTYLIVLCLPINPQNLQNLKVDQFLSCAHVHIVMCWHSFVYISSRVLKDNYFHVCHMAFFQSDWLTKNPDSAQPRIPTLANRPFSCGGDARIWE